MIEIIPAIDIIEGKCVRLSQGDYDQKKVYNENPVEIAKQFADAGLNFLHLVDLDGAKAQHIVNYNVLENIAEATNLVVDFGGGLKSDDDLRIAFECGATRVTGGSIAVKNPDIFRKWIQKFGSDKIILGADVKNERIAVAGWMETTEIELIPFIADYVNCGIKRVICTDIDKDGMLQGSSIDLYDKILKSIPQLHLIASGGVNSIQDIENLQKNGLKSVIIGKAIYEQKITLKELSKFIIS